MSKKKIAIVGHGFVGKATDKVFSVNIEKKIIDPKYGSSISVLVEFNPHFIIICVPTPMSKSGQDSKILNSVMWDIAKLKLKCTVVIKSTVLPNTLNNISDTFDQIVYNPEFLREKHAIEDFVNSESIILGGDISHCKNVADLYVNHSLCKTNNFIYTSISEASLLKYTINSYLAAKVIFFNQINDLYESMDMDGSNWNNFIKMLSFEKRIGSSHMSVPGHDGRKGYGGACFPKDVSALIKFAENQNVDLSLLNEINKVNNKIRSKYKNNNQREKDQNIFYD